MRLPLVFVAILLAIAPARADRLQIVLWNLEGPAGLTDRDSDLKNFGAFAKDADAVVLVETIGEDQLTAMKNKSGLAGLNHAISDFAKDSEPNPYFKLELGVLTPHAIGTVREADPREDNDTPAMRAKDEPVDVPAWLPATQRGNRAHRGWFWVELPAQKLVVIAVHLKSSRGDSGFEDKSNAERRENIAAALGVAIREDRKDRGDWSYVVAGDFNVAPGDAAKVGYDLEADCTAERCFGYDQTHALLTGGLVHGLVMRNLTEGLGATYASGAFVDSPIDNVLGVGPIFATTTRVTAERGQTFGSDHFSVRVTVE